MKRYRRAVAKTLGFAGGALAITSFLNKLFAQTVPTPERLISSFPEFVADVVIYKDGDYAVAVDRKGREIGYSQELGDALSLALNSLTPNRTWKETVVVIGSFTITKPLKPSSYLRLVFCGYIKVSDGANCPAILFNDNVELKHFELLGGVFDGNAQNQTDDVFAVIRINPRNAVDLRIADVSVVNAVRHGIAIGEQSGGSKYRKIVERCHVYNVGVKYTGYGIYFDHVPKAIVRNNYVEPVQYVDAIELGHGDYIVENNIVVGGTINFPYADNTIIRNNILIGATIQNDGSEAHNVLIEGNRIFNASPAPGYAGIRVSGHNARIIGNYVEINNDKSGIKVVGKYSKIVGNHVVQLSPTQGVGIKLETHYGDVIRDNIIEGFSYGIAIDWDFAVIHGNTIRNCSTGIFFVPTSTSGHKMIGNRVKNNIFENVTTPIDVSNQLDGNLVEGVVYESLPTYTDGYRVGDEILYYDGQYYYKAVWNGSEWIRVQLS